MGPNTSESGRTLLRRVGVALPLLASISLLLSPGAAAAQQRRSALGEFAAYPGLENIELQYDSIRIVGTTFYLVGNVDLIDSEHDVRLLADELSFSPDTATFEATGRVSFEQGDLLLNGTAMRGDLDAGTMEMENVVGVAPGPFYIRGRLVQQLEPGKFRVEKGVVTPCNQTTAIWEFRAGSMTFKPGSYVKMSWPHLRVKGIPIFGFPFLYWPLQDSNRQTGLMIPAFGTSNRKGFMFSQSAFWAITRSLDLTLTYEHFANAGNAFGGEFRYALAQVQGNLRAYYLPGRSVTPEESAEGKIPFGSGFSLTGSHIQNLPGGFVLRARANLVSSTEFARGFSDDVNRFLQRQSLLSADISKHWGASTLALVSDHAENFNNKVSSTIGRRLPQIKYTLRSTQVAGPIYVSLQSSAARFQKLQKSQKRKGEVIDGGAYQRFDAFPEVTVQITQIPWLTFNPFFRWRATYWTHSQTKKEFKFVNKPLFRNFFETGIEMVGPSIVRIFERPNSEYSPRLKHLIQPRLVYRRVHQFKVKDSRIIQFDEVDAELRADQQDLRFEITTRLFAKRYLNPNDEQRQVWQMAEFTVGRAWDLQPGLPQLERADAPRILLPYFTNIIVQPTNRVYLRSDMNFSASFQPANFSLNATINGETTRFGLTWFRGVLTVLDPSDLTQVLVDTNSNSLAASANFSLFARKLTVGAAVALDLFQSEVRSVDASLAWNQQCCSLGLNVRRLNFTDRQETQFSFLLTLARVTTLGFDNHRR